MENVERADGKPSCAAAAVRRVPAPALVLDRGAVDRTLPSTSAGTPARAAAEQVARGFAHRGERRRVAGQLRATKRWSRSLIACTCTDRRRSDGSICTQADQRRPFASVRPPPCQASRGGAPPGDQRQRCVAFTALAPRVRRRCFSAAASSIRWSLALATGSTLN